MVKSEIIGVRVDKEYKEYIRQKCKEKGYDKISDCLRIILESWLGS